MEPLKIMEFSESDFDEGMTREQKENLFLWMMYESAVSELAGAMDDYPTPKEALDHLFKGRRQSKDVRAAEMRLIDLIEEEIGRTLQLLEDSKLKN